MGIAAHRCPKAIPWLLELGLELSLPGAVASGNADAVRTMVAADPELVNDDSSFYLAVNHRQREIVELLLELGFDPNYPGRDSSWGRALVTAAGENDVEIMMSRSCDFC